MKLLRLTRHAAEEAQVAELQHIYGQDLEISEILDETLPTDSRGAVARFDELADGFDVVEAVLPPNLLEAVLKFSEHAKSGKAVIRAATTREVDAEGKATFEFSHYEKVLKVEVVTERL